MMQDHKEAERLLLQTARGDRAAFGALYDCCSRSVYAYALSVLRTPDAADDVTQETFLKIFRAAPTYRPQGKPMAWILQIARNLCMDALRRPATEALNDTLPAADPMGGVLERTYLRTLCRELLSEEEREFLTLHIDLGLAHTEIAQMLGKSAAAVRWKYAYALKKLRKRCLQDAAL